jgi:hypothetical protein
MHIHMTKKGHMMVTNVFFPWVVMQISYNLNTNSTNYSNFQLFFKLRGSQVVTYLGIWLNSLVVNVNGLGLTFYVNVNFIMTFVF